MKSTIWQRLNRHIEKFPCVLIEHKDGGIYLLKEHWKFLNPYKQCQRLLLGKGRISPHKYEYLTDSFPIYQRTKF